MQRRALRSSTRAGRLAAATVALLVLSGCDGTVTPDPEQPATETEQASASVDDSPYDLEATVTPYRLKP